VISTVFGNWRDQPCHVIRRCFGIIVLFGRVINPRQKCGRESSVTAGRPRRGGATPKYLIDAVASAGIGRSSDAFPTDHRRRLNDVCGRRSSALSSHVSLGHRRRVQRDRAALDDSRYHPLRAFLIRPDAPTTTDSD